MPKFVDNWTKNIYSYIWKYCQVNVNADCCILYTLSLERIHKWQLWVCAYVSPDVALFFAKENIWFGLSGLRIGNIFPTFLLLFQDHHRTDKCICYHLEPMIYAIVATIYEHFIKFFRKHHIYDNAVTSYPYP